MRTARVRRVPVLDAGGHLEGVLSIDDIIGADRTATSEPTRSSIRCATCRFDGPGPFDRETY
jgi:hypothetical protein